MEPEESGSGALQTNYQPTAAEAAAVKRVATLMKLKAPDARVLPSGKITVDHPDELYGAALLMEALGTDEFNFAFGLLWQLGRAASSGGKVDVAKLNFMLSVIRGQKPKDEIEAMLLAKIAIVDGVVTKFAERLQAARTHPELDSAERAFNRSARTLIALVEGLKRYRTGGEQKVTVQNVSIQEGGQAIVGNVNHSPREIGQQRVEVASIAPASQADATTIIDAECVPVPASGPAR